MEEKNILGPYLKNHRIKLGISQDYLAARLTTQGIKCDRSIISKIENQTRQLYDYEILGICQALSISIIDLFNEIRY